MESRENPEITQLFLAAREMTAGERKRFLDRECAGEPSRRRAVEDLLSHDVDGATEQLRVRAASPERPGSDGRRRSESLPDRIGSKQIVRKIGHGGMGVVYLARDVRLEREVAIKALPDDFARSPERLARFEREARTLARLNHPNVAGIYDVEEQDNRRYLVLEYVEGETLAERVRPGPIPVHDAIEIAIGIARGVEAAHNAGVVHRDLKPANIKITPAGEVKVLDFGLATDGGEAAGVDDPSADRRSPTIPGAILGTAAYMSPEQARGRVVDRRTDLWSFGVVLYEMLTGVCPFAGETISDSIGSVLHKEIDLDSLPPATPARVRELLQRMLQRDRDQRMRDAGDVMLELELARTEPPTEPVTTPTIHRLPWFVGALGLIVAAAALGWAFFGDAGGGEPVLHFSQVTDFEGTATHPSLTPDARFVVYAWRPNRSEDWDIYSQRIGGFNRVNLTKDWDADDEQPAVSPDGGRIAFRSARDGGGLFVMGATGESPRRLTEDGADPAWSPDGKRIAFTGQTVVDPQRLVGGSLLRVLTLDDDRVETLTETIALQPAWSPTGSRIAYWALDKNRQRDLYTIASDGSEPPRAVLLDAASDWSPRWSPDGRWLYFSSNRAGTWDLWRIAIDEASGATRGDPEPMTAGLAGLNGWLDVAGTADRLVFVSRSQLLSVYRATLDPVTGVLGRPERLTSLTLSAGRPSISPDGQWVAYEGGGENEDLYTIRADGTDRRQITDDDARNRSPVWSPDGERIYFSAARGDTQQIWSCRPDGSDPVQHTNQAVADARLSPDGSQFVTVSGGGLLAFDAKKPFGDQNPEVVVERLGGPALIIDWTEDGFLVAELNLATMDAGILLLSPEGEVVGRFNEDWLTVGGTMLSATEVLWGSDFGVVGADAATGEWTNLTSGFDPPLLVTSLSASADRSVVVFSAMTERSQIRVVDLETRPGS